MRDPRAAWTSSALLRRVQELEGHVRALESELREAHEARARAEASSREAWRSARGVMRRP